MVVVFGLEFNITASPIVHLNTVFRSTPEHGGAVHLNTVFCSSPEHAHLNTVFCSSPQHGGAVHLNMVVQLTSTLSGTVQLVIQSGVPVELNFLLVPRCVVQA
ncbi:unnamed protein product [Boreogadus saida]